MQTFLDDKFADNYQYIKITCKNIIEFLLMYNERNNKHFYYINPYNLFFNIHDKLKLLHQYMKLYIYRLDMYNYTHSLNNNDVNIEKNKYVKLYDILCKYNFMLYIQRFNYGYYEGYDNYAENYFKIMGDITYVDYMALKKYKNCKNYEDFKNLYNKYMCDKMGHEILYYDVFIKNNIYYDYTPTYSYIFGKSYQRVKKNINEQLNDMSICINEIINEIIPIIHDIIME